MVVMLDNLWLPRIHTGHESEIAKANESALLFFNITYCSGQNTADSNAIKFVRHRCQICRNMFVVLLLIATNTL